MIAKMFANVSAKSAEGTDPHPAEPSAAPDPVIRTEAEWRATLTPEQFHVLREHGTERAFSGHHADFEDTEASFVCAGCGASLFRAEHKYDSGSGWPSFFAPVAPSAVETAQDVSHGMSRIEVHCARCRGHLGHVFHDGPKPTGLRYCINAVSLRPVVPRDETIGPKGKA
jgi:peptide-methionine (R)-S-oxide reductase